MIFSEEQTRINKNKMHKETNQNRAITSMNKDTKFMRYIWIPPSQNKFLIINISTYINNSTHTSLENTLSK